VLTDGAAQCYPAIKVLDCTKCSSALRLLSHKHSQGSSTRTDAVQLPPAPQPPFALPLTPPQQLEKRYPPPPAVSYQQSLTPCPAPALPPGHALEGSSSHSGAGRGAARRGTARCAGRVVRHTPRGEPSARSSWEPQQQTCLVALAACLTRTHTASTPGKGAATPGTHWE